MSYYSEVAIAMRKEDYELLKEFDKENENLRDLLNLAIEREYEGAISLKWGELKWYPEFPEIQAIDEFLAKLSDEDKPYKFIELGEAIDDTKVEYNYGDEEKYGEVSDIINNMIGVTRYIDSYVDYKIKIN